MPSPTHVDLQGPLTAPRISGLAEAAVAGDTDDESPQNPRHRRETSKGGLSSLSGSTDLDSDDTAPGGEEVKKEGSLVVKAKSTDSMDVAPVEVVFSPNRLKVFLST